MAHDAALEAHEQAEHAEHAQHAQDPFIARVTITIAVLAVLAATVGSLETVEAGGAITASAEAVLAQDKATDSWGFYEAKSLKKNLYGLFADQGGPKGVDYRQAEARNGADEAKIQEEAKKNEQERDVLLAKSRLHEHRHHWLTAASTLLEVGIAICTVAIITRKKPFWLGSLALAAGGLALTAIAYLTV
jgi:hypothetical protein